MCEAGQSVAPLDALASSRPLRHTKDRYILVGHQPAGTNEAKRPKKVGVAQQEIVCDGIVVSKIERIYEYIRGVEGRPIPVDEKVQIP